MPEGDTIYRTAATLHRVLAGQEIVRVESAVAQVRPGRFTGHRVTSVESRGKWLLVHFDHGLVLLTHMRMHGSWHTYPRGDAWKKPRAAMRVVLATARAEAVAFDVPVIEVRAETELAAHPALSRLGPDLLSSDPDEAGAVVRLKALGGIPIGEALLRQQALAGIGNVFKSEVLFLCGVHPATAVSVLPDATLGSLVRTAVEQLRRNAEGPSSSAGPGAGARRTTRRMNPAEPLWVYGRAGRPCRRCGNPIEALKMGPDARLTYWCPGCQKHEAGSGIRDPGPGK